jgi:predicted GTPase
MESSKVKTILLIGEIGVGKSNLCNFLLDGKASGRFESSAKVVSGVTKTIRSAEGHALGYGSNIKIRVYDMPGFGDPD